MKKIFKFFFLSFLIFSSISLPARPCEKTEFVSYKNEKFNYEIGIPVTWKRSELTLENKHIMHAYPDKYTEIKIKAIKSNENDIEKIVHNNKWDLRKIDPRIKKIIETGNISITRNVNGKLLVLEYHTKNNSILQRSLITINNGIVYLIECKSPVKNFYNYDNIFTLALASFGYLNAEPSVKVKEEIPSETAISPSSNNIKTDIKSEDMDIDW